MDKHLEFIDALWFVYLDKLHIGPENENMITSSSLSPEIWKGEYTSHVFKLCCLCLGHVVPELPNLSLRSPNRSVTGVDLADAVELL